MKKEIFEVGGIKFKRDKGLVEYNCFGCAFQDDKKGCDAANEVHECGQDIYKREPIKPIDEHEWYDEKFVSLNLANSDEIAFDIPDFIAPVCFNLSDVEVMAGHFGYKMVKA